jgi:hypothetical protein
MSETEKLVPVGQPRLVRPFSFEYLGDFSATPAWASRSMQCESCRVSWTGCWDNFQCPKCGEGDLPSADMEVLLAGCAGVMAKLEACGKSLPRTK